MAVCRGGGSAVARTVLFVDMSPWAVHTAKEVCAGCTTGWLCHGHATVFLPMQAVSRHWLCAHS